MLIFELFPGKDTYNIKSNNFAKILWNLDAWQGSCEFDKNKPDAITFIKEIEIVQPKHFE